jgi:DNA polymerase-3 subunit delta
VDYRALLQAADRGEPPPLALLHGGDAQLVDDALARVTAGLFADPTELALGREVLEGDETTAEAVVRSAMTLPLMTRRRLVVVRRCQALPARGADTLGAYARDPNPGTCLLLLADEPLAGQRDRRDHWLLGVLPAAAVVALPAWRGRMIEDWLKQRAAREDLAVGDEAARLLVQWVGEDGARLLGEARKAALAGGPDNRTVGVTEVTAIVGEHRVADVFELLRAVERGEPGAALRTLERLLATEPPVLVLAHLTTSTRMALTARELAGRGEAADAIARALRRPLPVVQALLPRVTGPAGSRLGRLLDRCWETEWRLKSGGEPRAELVALVTELCGAG